MSIRFQCPDCQKPFRVAAELGGKTFKCTGCGKIARVPPAAGFAAGRGAKTGGQGWYIRSEDGQQLGPVSKEQLDNLATKGRLGFCQVRRQDWQSWQWADDVYPDLPVDRNRQSSDLPCEAEGAGPKPQFARLVPSPDCGNTLPRRAAKGPHCGRPAAARAGVRSAAGAPAVAAPPAAGGPEQPAASGGHSWRFWAFLAGAMLLVATIIATPLVIGWQVRPAAEHRTAGLAPVVEEALPAEPSEELLSPEEETACIDQAAGEMARRIDAVQSRAALATSLLGSSLKGLQMLEALAGGDLSAIPDSTGTVPGGGVEPYESQFEALFAECRDDLRKNVKRGACTKSEVWQTAEAWALGKRRAMDQALIERIPRQPGLRERPVGK